MYLNASRKEEEEKKESRQETEKQWSGEYRFETLCPLQMLEEDEKSCP
jgi:hypothetical protein